MNNVYLLKRKKQINIENYDLLSSNTCKAYSKGWNCFKQYCESKNVKYLPSKIETVSAFLQKSEHLSTATLELYLSAINKVHVINGYNSFNNSILIKATMRNLLKGSQPQRQIKALSAKNLKLIIDDLSDELIDIRNGAILSVGFAAALRRSEICALKVEDIEFKQRRRDQQMFVNIRQSKTDQAGRGYRIAVINGSKIKPVSRLKDWLDQSQIKEGYLFRAVGKGGKVKETPLHHSDIPRLVKHYVASIGLDPQDYAGHSLRAGFITSAAIHKARLDKIMEVSRHKSTDMVMSYVRDSNIFDNHAGKDFL